MTFLAPRHLRRAFLRRNLLVESEERETQCCLHGELECSNHANIPTNKLRSDILCFDVHHVRNGHNILM